jgi:hypothetical protein
VSKDPPEYDIDGKEIYLTPAKEELSYRSKWSKRYLTRTADEAHGIKHPTTRNFAGFYLAEAEFTILMTATPMQNNPGDFVGLAKSFKNTSTSPTTSLLCVDHQRLSFAAMMLARPLS